MKNIKKTIGVLTMMLVLLWAGVSTAAAAYLGDDYAVYGFQLGWVLIIVVVVIFLLGVAKVIKADVMKRVSAVLVILLIVGLALSFVEVSEPPAQITENVNWSVSATADQGNVTINNDARTITVLCRVNATGDLILMHGGTSETAAMANPIINFTISPTQTAGLTDTTKGATTQAAVSNPAATYTEDGTSYYLFDEVSTGGKRALNWTNDGTTEYESRYVTVNLGSTETVLLEVNYLAGGVSQLDAGESKVTTVTIASVSYTMTILVTGAV